MTYGPSPATLQHGQTYAGLVVDAVGEIRGRGLGAVMTPLASSAHHMVESALDEYIHDPTSRALVEQGVAPALQIVETLAKDFVSGSGVGQELAKEVLSLVQGVIGAEAAGAVASAIPVIGSLVSWFSTYFDMRAKQEEINQQIHAAECATAFVPVVGSWPGNAVRPADIFYSTSAHDFTSAGATLWSVLGTKRSVFHEDCARAAENVRDHWPPCHYQHHHDALSFPERASLRAVFNAMVSLAGRFETDGGASLWPAFIDILASSAKAGHLTPGYVQAVRSMGDDCWNIDARPTATIFSIIDGWLKTLDFHTVNHVPLLDAATIRTVVSVAVAHARGLPVTRISIAGALSHAVHRTATAKGGSTVALLSAWEPGQPWPL